MTLFKPLILALILAFTLSQQPIKTPEPSDTRIPVIAVISQPATTYNSKFPDAGANWSEVVGSYVDWVSQTGAEVALIPFDMPWQTLTQVLSMTDAMVLPGGAAELVDFKNNNATTAYMDRIHAILGWAKEQKTKHKRFYPVWGTCLGFEEMVIHFAENSGHALQDGFEDHAKYHPVNLTQDFWKSKFFSDLSVPRKMVENVFSRPIAYYYHSEGIATSHFQKHGNLAQHVTLLGSSKNDQNKEFAAIFESKKYPMWFVQFHPEKHQFERRESYKPMDRSEQTIRVMSSFIFRLVGLAREHGKPKALDEIPQSVQSYFPMYKQPIWSPSKAFERIYMFKNYFGLPKEKPTKSKLMRLLTTLKKNVAKADKVLGK